MNSFEGTKKFKFEQFGLTWRLELTYTEVSKLIEEGITVTEEE